jgi:hypothetical protein
VNVAGFTSAFGRNEAMEDNGFDYVEKVKNDILNSRGPKASTNQPPTKEKFVTFEERNL